MRITTLYNNALDYAKQRKTVEKLKSSLSEDNSQLAKDFVDILFNLPARLLENPSFMQNLMFCFGLNWESDVQFTDSMEVD
jgi:hypothetical protein